MWTCGWLLAAVLAITAEGAVRVPLQIGRRNGTMNDLVLPADVQKLGTILDKDSAQLWPQTHYAPAEISANASSWRDIKMSLLNGYDNIYFINAQVGTPPQNKRMIMDTGSSDMWVVKTSYDAEASSTSTLLENSQVTIRYGMGAMSGSQVKDRVCFASLCMDDQVFVVDQQDSMNMMQLTDGLFGLAYPALALCSGTPLLQNLASNGPFTNFSFALSLRHWDDIEESSIVIGDLKDVLAEAPSPEGMVLPLLGLRSAVTREPLPPMFWAVPVYVSIGLGQQALVPAVLDSGTSLLVVPKAELTQLLTTLIPARWLKDCLNVHGKPILVCPCETPMQSMFFFKGGPLTISLTREDFLLPLPGVLIGPLHNGVAKTQACRLGIMAGPPALNFWLFGDVFLRKVYAVHDVIGRRVMLFPPSGLGGQTLSNVGSNGVTVAAGILAERAGQQVTALVLLFFTAVAFTFTFAACSRFHGQARVSEMGGYHHF